MQFAQVVYNDLYEIRSFQPEGWQDIVPYFKFYIDSEFCMPVKALLNNKIVGVGACIILNDSAWLAHIIVSAEFRGKGIGQQIVEKLLKILKFKPVNSVLLVATELGVPLYKKAGFKILSEYEYFRCEKHHAKFPKSKHIIPYENKFRRVVFDLDHQISGEDRSLLLAPHLPESFVYHDEEKVNGIYVPALGEGLIVADSPEAGIGLMKFKHSKIDLAVLPAENLAGIEFLKQNGFVRTNAKGTRMILGADLVWTPEKIYSRIGGNLG